MSHDNERRATEARYEENQCERENRAADREQLDQAREVVKEKREAAQVKRDCFCFICKVPFIVQISAMAAGIAGGAVVGYQVTEQDKAIVKLQTKQDAVNARLEDIKVIRQMVEDIRDGRTTLHKDP